MLTAEEKQLICDFDGVTSLVHDRTCLGCKGHIGLKSLSNRQHGWLCDNCDALTAALLAKVEAAFEAERRRKTFREDFDA